MSHQYEIPESYQEAIPAAEDGFNEFYQHNEPSGYDHLVLMQWPEVQGFVGQATRIGYWSDKFDKEWREYSHVHRRPLPRVVSEFSAGDKKQKPLWKMPRPPVFTFLAQALDLEFKDHNGDIGFYDWKEKGKRNLPIIGWYEPRRILIIQPLNGDPPILLSSRILTVTERGIEN